MRMFIRFIGVLALTVSVFATTAATAADWTITQTATVPSATPALNQGTDTNVTSGVQSLNGVRLLSTADDVAPGSSQLATITSTTSLQLTQGNNAITSEQALNYLSAHNINGETANTVTQTVTSQSTTTTLTQEPTSGAGGNVQALNLAKAANDLFSLDQIVTESGSITLSQDDTTTPSNTQAVNFASAMRFGAATGTLGPVSQTAGSTGATRFEQDAEGGENVQGGNIARLLSTASSASTALQSFTVGNQLQLEQDMDAGTDNVQAVNIFDATDSATGIIGRGSMQEVTVSAGTTSFQQTASTENNVQAGNFADGNGFVNGITQTFNAAASTLVDFDQTDGGNALQAGNAVRSTGVSGAGGLPGQIANVVQAFTASSTNNDFTQDTDTNGNEQALNYLDAGVAVLGGGSSQTFTAGGGAIDFVQSGNGANNVQSINRLIQGTVTAATTSTVTQSVVVGDGVSLKFEQNDGDGSEQAGNYAEINGVMAAITSLTQTFTGSGTNNDIEQIGNADNRIQALNLVDLGTGAITDATGPHQTFDAGGSVDMVQEGGGSNNLQSLNAVVDAPGGTAAITLSQSINPRGTFSMKQNAVTSSGQFGNYAGGRF